MSSADGATKDFYKILGVSKDASQSQIKKAYRKLARDNHPDSHPDNKQAEDRFKEVSEAYAVLSNPEKRKEYDEQQEMFSRFGGGFGGSGFGGGFGRPGGGYGTQAGATQMDFDLSDLLGGMFGSGDGRSRTRARRGEDLQSEASISFEQAVDGATIPLRLSSDEACPTCHGTGAKPGTAPKVCAKCEGSGMQTSTSGGVFAMTEPCSNCGGRGMIVETPCETCRGQGRRPATHTVNVRVPAGVQDGQRIRIKGKGGAGANGGPDGDLFLLVHVADHPEFGRRGKDLTVDVPIAFDDAVLGANISVKTLHGDSVTLKIPAGTPSGRTFRVRGRGAQTRTGDGDLLVTVVVQVPTELDDEQRAAVEAYRLARTGQEAS